VVGNLGNGQIFQAFIWSSGNPVLIPIPPARSRHLAMG
jgi:hypothetical protein